ncbi:NADH dehydrogenase [ubiquinone] 1 alpha subcomplex subunit 13-like [Physella acuta]|uniref:NADH dehydrogenase [ubiquinone] 1 alpha subcomplex subunit 13-like n=1 Tax=Physella acuta TaxID=109671 RepID=UPI0027DC8158|nr:NADH dehydrogenase [ubiquinone] 1 alpha subcomplex subunit 13-like [Physella acuta]
MVTYKQDLPPEGGFSPFEWAARGPKRLFNGYTQIGLFVGFTAVSWGFFLRWQANKRAIDLEMRDARLAVEPILEAERDREFLKLLRRNRDEENELMKNVKGWKTGTLWGEPVYHNPGGHFILPIYEELCAHMSTKDKNEMFLDHMKRNV